MAYTITSDRLDCPKAEGEMITEEELLKMGVNILALVEGGHISPDATSAKKAKLTDAPTTDAPSAVDPTPAVESTIPEGETA
jgi:hypothetical protein